MSDLLDSGLDSWGRNRLDKSARRCKVAFLITVTLKLLLVFYFCMPLPEVAGELTPYQVEEPARGILGQDDTQVPKHLGL